MTTPSNAGTLTAAASGEARFFANSVASWYLATLDPYAPHTQNVESRLRHPVHVVTRRILYGNIHATEAADGSLHGDDDLEALFNDDDAEIKDGGPETLTRRSAARMEAFLASCSVALREDIGNIENVIPAKGSGVVVSRSSSNSSGTKLRNGVENAGKDDVKKGLSEKQPETPSNVRRARAMSSSSAKNPRTCRQIDHGDLMLRLDLYCRTLRRIRSLMDANPEKQIEDCVIQYEPKKTIRARVQVIVQTFLRNVDCVRDVHTTLMNLILRATLEVLAVEVWCDDLKSVVDRLTSEYEHKVSFASLAFLSSPDKSADTHLAPLLTKYFEYLQSNYKSLTAECELERMLRTIIDADLRQFFKNATFHSVGHILDVCRSYRESLDNIALPPPWKEGVFGMVGGGDVTVEMDEAISRYVNNATLVKQALRDLRREVITVNGQVLPPAHSSMELAEYLGQILNSNQLTNSLSPRKSIKRKVSKKKSKKKFSNYTSDFGLEDESDFASGGETDNSVASKIDVGIVDVLTRRLLIAASRTGAGGDAYFVVRDLFGGDEVEVVPHHSSKQHSQGTIEIIVKLSSVIIKSHAKFDIFPKPIVSDSDALIQFHTTTTETISLQHDRARGDDATVTVLKEKKTNMSGWRTLAIRPAYYERVIHQ